MCADIKQRSTWSFSLQTFDRNGDGFITATELRHVMTCLGERLSERDVTDMIKAADIDGNGRIDYEGNICQLINRQYKAYMANLQTKTDSQ